MDNNQIIKAIESHGLYAYPFQILEEINQYVDHPTNNNLLANLHTYAEQPDKAERVLLLWKKDKLAMLVEGVANQVLNQVPNKQLHDTIKKIVEKKMMACFEKNAHQKINFSVLHIYNHKTILLTKEIAAIISSKIQEISGCCVTPSYLTRLSLNSDPLVEVDQLLETYCNNALTVQSLPTEEMLTNKSPQPIEPLVSCLSSGLFQSGSESDEIQLAIMLSLSESINRNPFGIGNIEELKIQGIIGDEFSPGKAMGGGDCFFDSVSQALIPVGLRETTKSLRKLCAQYVENSTEKWLKEALNQHKIDYHGINDYISRIAFTAEDITSKKLPTTPIWGRAEIEGRMICSKLNITLHLIEIQKNGLQNVPCHIIVDKNGMRCVAQTDAASLPNCIHMLISGNHFVPLLQNDISPGIRPGSK